MSYGYNKGGAAGRVGADRPSLGTLVRGLPATAARDWKDSPGMAEEVPGRTRLDHLPRVIHGMPSPRASDGPNGEPNMRGSKGDLMLPSFVHNLPTPTAGDAKASDAAGYSTSSGRHSGTTLTDAVLGAASSGRHGKLSPQLVEWMMDLPPGYSDPTGCVASATSALPPASTPRLSPTY